MVLLHLLLGLFRVASAAPKTPHLKIYINKKSKIILLTPEITDIISPNVGFSSTIKKLWKAFCDMNGIKNISSVLPYVIQSASIVSFAPSSIDAGFVNKMPITENTNPRIISKYISIEKYLFAFSFSPSPIVFETKALPPVPIMKPIEPNIINAGIIKFTAANPSEPTQFDTNIPSTTPYIDVNIIIIIVGIVNFINFLYVKFSDNCIFI